MRTDSAPSNAPMPTRLSDYVAPEYAIDDVYIDVALDPQKTRVHSKFTMRRTGPASAPLVLNGEDIALESVRIDGVVLSRKDYKLTQTHLTVKDLPESFALEIISTCAPKDNSQLMGLYVSGGRFCTQCEAEGFRRFTYFMDRPDVLTKFTVRMQADKAQYPTLLANGNRLEFGDLENGAHYAIWEDPFPKPSYLFAMVAGEFDRIEDSFTTLSGREILLEVYVDPGDASRAYYAMDALKRSMVWDEKAFGREYDLDRFMIVAVRDFNFGAMENKGLNIFNSALLLADAQSATDLNYQRIESVVAHEYFHNWTGNRITCRDWFQLCLKEGFTVFRDQEFSAHERGAPLQRIKDVKALRARQFPEDSGPLSHPVRPESYLKIDNFYTATVYEKGAELIRMLKILLGADDFRKGCDHYFKSLDGTAATIEQFLAAFETATGQDLSHFALWYAQAGTPEVTVSTQYDEAGEVFEVTLKQMTPPTPGQRNKAPLVIPIAMSLLTRDDQTEEHVHAFDEAETTLRFADVTQRPVLSILRGFSAPVKLIYDRPVDDLLTLMARDNDLFSRWEAGQTIARSLLVNMSKALQSGVTPNVDPALKGYVQALRSTLEDAKIDPGFKALALVIPGESEILQQMHGADPVAIHEAAQWLRRAIADECLSALEKAYAQRDTTQTFSPDAKSANLRALANAALSLMAVQGRHDTKVLAREQFTSAKNMTDELSALITLQRTDIDMGMTASQQFYDKWQDNPLVIDKWFAVQSGDNRSNALATIAALLDHAAYESHNPNRVRALVGGFAMSNPKTFHALDGSGYNFFTQRVLDMDGRNPSVAARLLGAYEIWPRLDNERQVLIKAELAHIIASGPSKNVLEIATKTLAG